MDWNRWKRQKREKKNLVHTVMILHCVAQHSSVFLTATRVEMLMMVIMCKLVTVRNCERDAWLLAELDPEDAAVHAGGSVYTVKACSFQFGCTCVH